MYTHASYMVPRKLLGKLERKRMAFCETGMYATKHGIPEESAEGRSKPLYCGFSLPVLLSLLSVCVAFPAHFQGSWLKLRQVPTAPTRAAGWLSPIPWVGRPGSSSQVCESLANSHDKPLPILASAGSSVTPVHTVGQSRTQ